MKWFKKYIRTSYNKQEILDEIEQHSLILAKTNEALDKLEKLSLDGEDHWLEDAQEMECVIESVKLKRSSKDGTFTGITRAHCRP